MRLFISINFDDVVQGDLAAVVDELRRRSHAGVFTLPENLHLTLAFLGECDHHQKELAVSLVQQSQFEPFLLRIEGMGIFKQRGGELWWAGVARTESLLELQAGIVDELRIQGFELESRKFKPHVTLGRQVVIDQRRVQHGGLIGTSVSQMVDSIALMQSERIAGRLTYTQLA